MMTDRKTYAEQLFGSAAAGQTLTEGEELLAAFLRSSNVGVGILDSNVRYLAVNKVLAEMSGVPAQDHLGRTVREVLGEIGELIEHKLSQVLATRQGLKFEVSGKVPSRGENRHWIIDMFPILSRQDSVTRIGAIVYELTTPTQLEKSLQQLDGQLRRETKRLRMLTDVMSLLSANWDIAQLFPDIGAASPGATPGICQFCPGRRRNRPARTSCNRFSAR
jgi:PAS domain S-box-containing protein